MLKSRVMAAVCLLTLYSRQLWNVFFLREPLPLLTPWWRVKCGTIQPCVKATRPKTKMVENTLNSSYSADLPGKDFIHIKAVWQIWMMCMAIYKYRLPWIQHYFLKDVPVLAAETIFSSCQLLFFPFSFPNFWFFHISLGLEVLTQCKKENKYKKNLAEL